MKNVNNEKVVFLDETWINENIHQEKGWTDDSIMGTLKAPIGKGKRLIICHAGSQNGWIKAPPLGFEYKKTYEYHEEMDHNVFESWFFKTSIPSIPTGTTIVMDNASYHSRQKDKAPTSNSTKAQMIEWLKDKKIPFPVDLLKPEVYQLVKLHKPPIPTYEIDSKAAELGFAIIRHPPHHCQYNPIEMVWAYLKCYVKERNATFKLKDIKQLLSEPAEKVTPKLWGRYDQHTKKQTGPGRTQ